jgi:TonB family protein
MTRNSMMQRTLGTGAVFLSLALIPSAASSQTAQRVAVQPVPAIAAAADRPAVRAPEIRNRQQVADMILQTNAGALIRSGVSGVAEVMIEVDTDGRAGAVQLVKSTGNRFLDSAIATLAARLTFVPAAEDGTAVRSFVMVPFIIGRGTIH